VPRHEARQRALSFSWEQASCQFLAHLVPAQRSPQFPAPAEDAVTALSSRL